MKEEIVNIIVGPDGTKPTYATEGSAGFDFYAASDHTLLPGGFAKVSTDLRMEIPEGWEIQVRPRSGMAYKDGVTVINSPGTIDSDFRETVHILLVNHGHLNYSIRKGDRIAQGILSPVYRAVWKDVEELSLTTRTSGLGSTGT